MPESDAVIASIATTRVKRRVGHQGELNPVDGFARYDFHTIVIIRDA